MACDTAPIALRLNAAGALIGGSVAFVASAAAANASFFAAVGAPGLMIGAGVCATLAGVALGEARTATEAVARCTGAEGKDCTGEAQNLLRSIDALRLAVSTGAGSCFAAAVGAWVPWVAQPVMWVILGALVAQGLLIPAVAAFATVLRRCAERVVEPVPTPSPIN